MIGAFFECKRGHVYHQRENWEDAQVIALVELDMQKMQVHIVLSREAIRKRLRELQHPLGPPRGTSQGGTSGRPARVE